ncbi:MAG: hypothetical protein IJX78_03680 [Bacilli bacterium]|nr:hypothetical protein [Bacilli bacterium]
MKRKWPKFLTLKRTVFIAIVLIAGIVLASYFLGGYEGITAEYDTRDFTLDGFTTYAEYEAKAKEEALKIPYDANDSFAEKVEKCNYTTQLQNVIAEIKKEITNLKANGGSEAEIADLETLSKAASRKITYKEIPTEAEYIKIYIEESLGFGTEPLMENGKYEFYFSKKWTTFKVVEKQTGNVWYSNPQETEEFSPNKTVLNQQKSLVNVYYASSLGGTTLWDSYTYAISDTDRTGEEALTPNFQIKEIKDENGKVTSVQVYYYFKQRGIDYTYIPQKINATKIKDISGLDLSVDENLPEFLVRNKQYTTDGAWEVVANLSGATSSDAEQADDNTMWYVGTGAPSDDFGNVGNYYIDSEEQVMYVKGTETNRAGQVKEVWEAINTDNLTWLKYLESNVSYNNLPDNLPVYAYGYFGEGAPLAEEGINNFYYYDTTTGDLYKKAGGTIPYTHVLSGKEITLWTTQYYILESEEYEWNTFGYDHYILQGSYEGLRLIVRKNLYSYYYQKCLYTEEDLLADNSEFGVETVSNKGEFGIAIEYSLNENGFSATILDESISELEEFPLTTVEILPYLTSAHYNKEGYVVIPDGSGAVMNFNNGKTTYVQYSKTVYTTDLSKMSEIETTETEDIMLPMYAMVNTYIPGNDGIQSGVLVDAISGTSQLRISANVSKITDSHNKVFFSAFYRESQKTTIGVGYYATTYTKWTEDRIHNDITVNYNFLDQDELDYSSIAKKYRELIIDRYGLEEKDTTEDTVLNVSLIGAYDFRNNFLGVGYTDYDAMTTFEQAEEILSDLKAHGANHINAYYLGWRKKGLVDYSFQNMKYSSELGNKADLDSLVNYSENNDINLYMDVNFSELNKYQESFGQSRYTSRDVAGEYIEKYPYDLSSGVYDKNQNAVYTLSPRFYGVFMENLVQNYVDDMGLASLSIKNLGSALASDYKRRNEVFKETALQETVKALEYAKENGINSITLYNPYDFAFKYTNNALEVPYASTQYEVLDYSIPFYQLVVSGLFDYSGEVINANDEKGSKWHIMHILETGSNAAFTFSYEDSSKLIQTDYKYYYYTQYSKWTEDVFEIVDVVDEIGIHECQLMSHERVANNTYKVTYTNGATNIEIILNYSDAAVEVDGNIIPAKNYIYNKNNSGWRE